MAASVGAVTVFDVRGEVRRPALTTEIIPRGNVDSLTIRKTGTRAVPSQLEVLQDVESGNLEAAQAALAALQGTVVTVTKHDGITHNNVLILFVDPREARYIRQAIGGVAIPSGGDGYMIRAFLDVVQLN